MRRVFRIRAWGISLALGAVISTAVCVAILLQRALSVSWELAERNQRTLAGIKCGDAGPAWTVGPGSPSKPTCDLTGIEGGDNTSEIADFVLDRASRYFLYNNSPLRHFWLDRADLAFLQKFRQAQSVCFETGECWTILSEPADMGGRAVEIVVAAFESAPELGRSSGRSYEPLTVRTSSAFLPGLMSTGFQSESLSLPHICHMQQRRR